MTDETTMSDESYKIHNGVLLAESGIAFLVEGNHSVLDYITGKLKPTQESFHSFKKNISNRAHIAKLCKCKYLHVIFPDKQSIIQKEFPVKNTIRLGDEYLSSLENTPLKDMVLYPADTLGERFNNVQPLDTHLSDHGSLTVLKGILDSIDEPAPESLAALKKLITKDIRNQGDLGSKFTPPIYQKIKALKPDWNFRSLSSNGSFNNGQIDIFLNPEAEIKKKVLIFGDSFFRLMLNHLSKVFREVVFLRTPYFHVEMIELIRPDIILTGNAERYLGNVLSDTEAPAFQSYAYTHNATSKPSVAFINAFRAVTSPSSKISKDYFNSFFNSSSSPKLVTGSSQVARWSKHLKDGILDGPLTSEAMIGLGGAPVWSKRLISSVIDNLTPETTTLLIVGDFQLGNDVCLHPAADSLPIFLTPFAGINGAAVNPENDKKMLDRCLQAISGWDTTLKQHVNFVFWDLLYRQVHDRLIGRHIKEKKYEHPHWNLETIQSVVPEEKLIDLLPLLKLPMQEVIRLFIDSNANPSQIGYLFLTNSFVYGADVMSAYNKAVYDVEKVLFGAAKSLVARKKRPITLCGRSVWLDTFIRYLGANGVKEMAQLGLSLAPFNSQLGHPALPNASLPLLSGSDLVLISENGLTSDVPDSFEKALLESGWKPTESNCFGWESPCVNLIKERNETPRALYGQLTPEAPSLRQIELEDADIELGPNGYPTINGLVKLLSKI